MADRTFRGLCAQAKRLENDILTYASAIRRAKATDRAFISEQMEKLKKAHEEFLNVFELLRIKPEFEASVYRESDPLGKIDQQIIEVNEVIRQLNCQDGSKKGGEGSKQALTPDVTSEEDEREDPTPPVIIPERNDEELISLNTPLASGDPPVFTTGAESSAAQTATSQQSQTAEVEAQQRAAAAEAERQRIALQMLEQANEIEALRIEREMLQEQIQQQDREMQEMKGPKVDVPIITPLLTSRRYMFNNEKKASSNSENANTSAEAKTAIPPANASSTPQENTGGQSQTSQEQLFNLVYELLQKNGVPQATRSSSGLPENKESHGASTSQDADFNDLSREASQSANKMLQVVEKKKVRAPILPKSEAKIAIFLKEWALFSSLPEHQDPLYLLSTFKNECLKNAPKSVLDLFAGLDTSRPESLQQMIDILKEQMLNPIQFFEQNAPELFLLPSAPKQYSEGQQLRFYASALMNIRTNLDWQLQAIDESLTSPKDLNDTIVKILQLKAVKKKVSDEVMTRIIRETNADKRPVGADALAEALRREANLMLALKGKGVSILGLQNDVQAKTHVKAVFTPNVKMGNCLICENSSHTTTKCRKLLNVSVPERWVLIREKKICACLHNRYGSCECRKRNEDNCTHCHKNHNTLLHQMSNSAEARKKDKQFAKKSFSRGAKVAGKE